MNALPEVRRDESLEEDALAARRLPPGHEHYRAYVGPPDQYDIMGASQFNLATTLGLQEENTLLDVGCGSLRAGRFFIQYLLPNRYFGIEPTPSLWREAVERELGRDVLTVKRPRFSAREDFRFDDSVRRYDCILAQSIFSHVGAEMLQTAIAALSEQLAPQGQFLFTAIDEEAASYQASLVEASGWAYPQCVRHARSAVVEACRAANLVVEKLDWHHPRQTWFRAVKSYRLLLGIEAGGLGNGRMLFNPRFR